MITLPPAPPAQHVLELVVFRRAHVPPPARPVVLTLRLARSVGRFPLRRRPCTPPGSPWGRLRRTFVGHFGAFLVYFSRIGVVHFGAILDWFRFIL